MLRDALGGDGRPHETTRRTEPRHVEAEHREGHPRRHHPEHGHRVMKEVADALGDLSRVESPPRLMGRRMTMLLTTSHKN